MDIQSYFCYILINCVLLFPSSSSKPISLNDIIAAEKQTASLKKPELKVSETKTNLQELPKNYKIFTTYSLGSVTPTNKKISPLKYKKTFQIRTPLKPKKIKYSYKPRSRRINTTTKRETDNDKKFNRNYIPLLKSLSVLFNNILSSDSGSDETNDEYYELPSFSRSGECACAYKSNYESSDQKSAKKTTADTSPITSKVSTKAKTVDLTETSSTSTYNTINDNISALRRNKNIPILSTRDSISSWRNHNGFSERGLSTHHRNFKGHITGNNGSDENDNSGRETTKSYTKNHKQYTNSSTGYYGCRNESCGAIGGNRYITSTTPHEAPTSETVIWSNETITNDRRNGHEYKGLDKFENRRNETESRIFLSESSSRLRRFESQEETTEISWQVETPKESIFELTYNFTTNQRLFNRDGTVAPKDQETRRANKRLTLDDLYTSSINTSKPNITQDKQKIVVIYDGYSVAKDVNGENKITEKAYRIHS